jgi:alpha/beta hydrolase family protein
MSASWLETMVGRYDPVVVDDAARSVRIRVVAPGQGAWDVVLAEGRATIGSADGRPHAVVTADAATWHAIVAEPHAAIDAYLAGRLSVRHNLHVGVGFLSATSGTVGPTRMRFRSVATRGARMSLVEAGEGPPILAVHGLGATKGSFLPTVAALSTRFHTIALDLPGFGDSSKRRRVEGGRCGRVPAGLPHARRTSRLLRRGAPHLPRQATRRGWLLASPRGAPG